MKRFHINEYLSLRLEDNKTIIYVGDKRFQQCKYILMEVPVNYPKKFDGYCSIDEFIEEYEKAITETKKKLKNIPLEIEFWAHCSNLQIWYENNYNTKLLHYQLAFPLLRELARIGDPLAKRVFKEELAKRMESGYLPVILLLLSENYIEYYFSKEELNSIFTLDYKLNLMKVLTSTLKEDIRRKENVSYALLVIRELIRYHFFEFKSILTNQLLNILKNERKEDFNNFIDMDRFFDLFSSRELLFLLYHAPAYKRLSDKFKKIFKRIVKIIDNEQEKINLIEYLLLIINYQEEPKKITRYLEDEILNNSNIYKLKI